MTGWAARDSRDLSDYGSGVSTLASRKARNTARKRGTIMPLLYASRDSSVREEHSRAGGAGSMHYELHTAGGALRRAEAHADAFKH